MFDTLLVRLPSNRDSFLILPKYLVPSHLRLFKVHEYLIAQDRCIVDVAVVIEIQVVIEDLFYFSGEKAQWEVF
jgi:hypothetical protein